MLKPPYPFFISYMQNVYSFIIFNNGIYFEYALLERERRRENRKMKRLVLIICMTLSPFTLKADDLRDIIIKNFGNPDLAGQYGQPEPISRRFINQKTIEISLYEDQKNIVGTFTKNAPKTDHGTLKKVDKALLKGKDQIQYGAWVDIKNFTIKEGFAGSLVSSKLNGKKEWDKEKAHLDGLLLVEGWAGDFYVGRKYSKVLFSLCGKIIGQVTPSRFSAFAKTMHQSLEKQGFNAEFQLKSLPRCKAPTLQAFAYDHLDQSLIKVAGAINIHLIGNFEEGYAGLTQLQLHAEPVKTLRVSLRSFNPKVRNCADSTCNVIGVLEDHAGNESYVEVMVLDRIDNFMLIKTQNIMGWIKAT